MRRKSKFAVGFGLETAFVEDGRTDAGSIRRADSNAAAPNMKCWKVSARAKSGTDLIAPDMWGER